MKTLLRFLSLAALMVLPLRAQQVYQNMQAASGQFTDNSVPRRDGTANRYQTSDILFNDVASAVAGIASTTGNDLRLLGTNGIVYLSTGGTDRWVVNASGAFNPIIDNTYDIGNGVVNPRDVQASRLLIAPNVNIGGVTSTGVTGSGNLVFSISPTFTGTVLGAALNFSGAGTFGGAVTTTGGTFHVSGAAGTARNLQYSTSESARWQATVSTAAESGSNVGSDYTIRRFSDAGALIDIPMTITRSTGATTFPSTGSHVFGTTNTVTLSAGALTTTGAIQAGGDISTANSASKVYAIGGPNTAPATSGTTVNHSLRIGSNAATGTVVDTGITSGSSYAWFQVRDAGNFANNYELRLNPNGGAVKIGDVAFATTTGALTLGTASSITAAASTALDLSGGSGGAGVKLNSGSEIKRVLTATAALDFGSILAAASADLTISVTGAAVGDSVMSGAPADPDASLAFDYFVSATNVVTVRAHNVGSIAVDQASKTFRATVMGF